MTSSSFTPKFSLKVMPVLVLVATWGAAMAAELPTLQFVAGDVNVVRADGSQSPARKGDVLNTGDRLVTGQGAMAQVRALDQGVVALRPDSEIQFKSDAAGLGVALNHGQLRTVTDLAGPQNGLLHVITPDSNIAVMGGDIETGYVPHAGGAHTYSQIRTGLVSLGGAGPESTPLALGESFKTAGDTPLAVQEMPTTMTQSMAPVGLVAHASPAALPITDQVSNIDIPVAVKLPTQNLGGLNPSENLGFKAGLGAQPINQNVAVPEIKAGFVTPSITGASAEVNEALTALPFISLGRIVDNSSRTLTPTALEAITPGVKTTIATFVPNTVRLENNQVVSAIKAASGDQVISQGAVVNDLVLVKATATQNQGAIVNPVSNQQTTVEQVAGQVSNLNFSKTTTLQATPELSTKTTLGSLKFR